MAAPRYQSDLENTVELLESWIGRRTGTKGVDWLKATRRELSGGAPDWKFFTAFSGAARHVGKADLNVSEADLKEADAIRTGWTPRDWSTDQAARAVLVLSYPHEAPETYVKALEQLFSAADVGESVALYQCLPLLPYPDRFRARAAEGLRSNMTSVFNAVAHDNPYPGEYFDDAAWNQMVLKALFVGSPLHRIRGLDQRANPDLARMLVDYARERRAAARSVSPELWRPVGPFAAAHLDDLRRALNSTDEHEREAAALALTSAGSREAAALLESQPSLKNKVESGELTWRSLSWNSAPADR